jgi:hypothetical protein
MGWFGRALASCMAVAVSLLAAPCALAEPSGALVTDPFAYL